MSSQNASAALPLVVILTDQVISGLMPQTRLNLEIPSDENAHVIQLPKNAGGFRFQAYHQPLSALATFSMAKPAPVRARRDPVACSGVTDGDSGMDHHLLSNDNLFLLTISVLQHCFNLCRSGSQTALHCIDSAEFTFDMGAVEDIRTWARPAVHIAAGQGCIAVNVT